MIFKGDLLISIFHGDEIKRLVVAEVQERASASLALRRFKPRFFVGGLSSPHDSRLRNEFLVVQFAICKQVDRLSTMWSGSYLICQYAFVFEIPDHDVRRATQK